MKTDYSQNFVTDLAVEDKFTPNAIEMMLGGLLRNERLFLDARSVLKTTHFTRHVAEMHYGLLWETTCNVYDKYRTLDQEILFNELAAKYVSSESEMDFNLWRKLLGSQAVGEDDGKEEGVLDYIFRVTGDIPETYIRDTLRKFLAAREVHEPLQALFMQANAAVPVAMAEILAEAKRKLDRIESVSSSCIQKPLPDDDEEITQGVKLFSTGIPFINNFIEGQAEDEVYTLIGPTGGGKTATAVKLCYEAGLYFGQQNHNHGTEMKSAVFVTFEEPGSRIGYRMAALAGQLDKGKLEKMKSITELNGPGVWSDYERHRWSTRIEAGGIECEYDRYQGAKRLLSKNVRIVDLSGVKQRGVGMGGIKDIVAQLRKVNDEMPIGFVTIDWAGICVGRYMAAQNIPPQYKRDQLLQFVDSCITEIAQTFHCPTWVMHQLSGEKNRSSPVAKVSASDAAECRSFHHNAHAAFTYGTQDLSTHVMQLHCDKSRRTELASASALIRIDGQIADLIWADDLYMVDLVQRKFVEKNASQMWHGERSQVEPNAAGMRRRRIPPTTGDILGAAR